MAREIYVTNQEYYVSPIMESDRNNYVELRKQTNGGYTVYLDSSYGDFLWKKLIDEQTVEGNDKFFSIFDKDNVYCGNLELQKPESSTPEIAIELMENMRNKGIAPKVVTMFCKKTCEIKDIDYFLIRISSNNLHSRHVFEKIGVVLIGEEECYFNKTMKRYNRLLSENNDGGGIYTKVPDEDFRDEVIYRYKLSPEVFMR
jgi:RimJ/RimL family protein N-acetyltransferase